jgi:hypothetical protein
MIMSVKKLPILSVVLVLVLATLACGFSASTANITKAVMTTDEAGQNETTVFAPTDVFYCIVTLANAPDDTKVKAVWTAVAVEGADPNTSLMEKEITTGLDTVTFNLSNNSPWPAGKYKVDILLNDKPAKTLEFEVQ